MSGDNELRIGRAGCMLLAVLMTAWMVFMFTGCSSVNEPEKKIDITGRYQDNDRSMILLLEHYDRKVSATLEWEGISTNLEGKFDAVNSQVIMNGDYYGQYNISFNLFYKDNLLSGGFVFANSGTHAVSFRFVNKLSKHDQGGIQ